MQSNWVFDAPKMSRVCFPSAETLEHHCMNLWQWQPDLETSRDTTRHGTWFPLQSTSWNVSANSLPTSDVASCAHSIHNVGPHSTQNCQLIKWGSPNSWIMPMHAHPWSKRCIVMAAIVIPPSLGIPRNRYAHLRINWWHTTNGHTIHYGWLWKITKHLRSKVTLR